DASSDVLLVKKGEPPTLAVVSPFLKLRPITPAPAVQLQFPFTTECNLIPPSMRRRFRSVIGAAEPENVCDRFQFSSRPSTKISTTRSASRPVGTVREA